MVYIAWCYRVQGGVDFKRGSHRVGAVAHSCLHPRLLLHLNLVVAPPCNLDSVGHLAGSTRASLVEWLSTLTTVEGCQGTRVL